MIKLVEQDSLIYNACDRTWHERGDMGKGKLKVKRIYSVWKIENGIAFCQSCDVWGGVHEEEISVNTLEAYEKGGKRT